MIQNISVHRKIFQNMMGTLKISIEIFCVSYVLVSFYVCMEY